MSTEAYRARMAGAHAEIGTHPGVLRLLAPGISPRLLHRFLIEYCALGVQITRPVEGWIRRAGQRCKEIGLDALGDKLTKHAAHEAGHDRLFVADAHALSRLYQDLYHDSVDVEALLAQPPTDAMQRYIGLHEEAIASSTPFAQVAIELEIEGLSVSIGPSFLGQIERVLGPTVLASCSFLTEHVEIDVGHTKLNEKMLERLLSERPGALPVLVDAGQRALKAYLDFLGECMDRASERSVASGPGAECAMAAGAGAGRMRMPTGTD